MTAILARQTASSLSCPPRFSTLRRPERATFGHELAAVADRLAQPFMPWQRHVADIGCEVDPATGLPAYREVVVTVPRQQGKALDVATPILTANRGWSTMGALRVGDQVFHPAGHSVEATFVSSVMLGHRCYRVTTTDGRSVVADADHLWTVVDKRSSRSLGPRGAARRWFETRVLTTRQMLDYGTSRYSTGRRTSVTGGKRYATNEYRFVLPIQEPLKSADVYLPIDPYLLGAWLGDGSSTSAMLTSHVSDVAHWCEAIAAAGFIPTNPPGGVKGNTRSVGITSAPGPGRNSRTFPAALRVLGVFGNKHVPDLYLTAGTDQREALLQGLMDTDGTVEPTRGQAEFCSTNQRLAEAALFLARSLGWRATMRMARATLNGRDCGPKYRVQFTPTLADPFRVFRLPRKASRVKALDGGKGRATLSIARIEPVESVPVRCIKVDSPDGLFLAGRDLVPTHNTTLFLSWQINRCNSARWSHPQRSVFTAQSGKDARDKWLDELFPLIRNSAIARLVSRKGKRLEINEGMGNESVRWATGSLIRLLSTSASSGHSKSIHQAVMDEIWHDADERREQGLRPAMITVPDAQLLVCSTAGTDASVILNRKVEAGRAATVADVGSGVAYFEWSAPDGWDPADEASYFGFMPALCPDPPCRCAPAGQRWRHTVTMDAIRSERAAMEPAEFARAYGNRKTSRMLQGVITEAQWRALQDPGSARVGDVALGADVDPLREFGSVAVFGLRADGLGHGHLVDYRPGVDWLPARLAELREALDPIGVALGRGTYESLRDDLEDVGLSAPEVAEEPCRGDVAVMTPMTMAAACGQMIDAVKQCSLRVRPSKPLDDAAAVGQVRQGADTVAWSPRVSGGQIGPIVSLTLARWLHGAWGELVAEANYDVLQSFY